MKMNFIPVNEPLLNGNEKKYLCECIDSGWISSEGPFVKKFESEMAQKVERKHGISVCNGTAALEVACQAIGIKAGDEVIMPTFTIISCAQAVTKLGGIPVLVDSDVNTWNMDVSQIEQKISKKTKAIMMVHIYGLPVDVDAVLEIADRYGIKVIEDAAEAHGLLYKGKPCGSFGDISIFSFYPNKHITTGEGGMVLVNDDELAEKCRNIRNLCFNNKNRYVHDEISGNYRFTNLQAAVGLAQLERLDEFVKIKMNMGRYYLEKLNDIRMISLPMRETEYANNIFWVFGIILENSIEFDNREAQRRLSDLGVGTRTFFWNIHEQPVYKNMGLFKEEKYPNAEKLARRGLYIPSGLALTREQMDEVVDKLITILK